jgi:hypothetical protein
MKLAFTLLFSTLISLSYAAKNPIELSVGETHATYYANGSKKTELVVTATCVYYKKFYSSGEIAVSGIYDHNMKKIERWLSYNSNGQLVSISNYREGKRHGEWKNFDDEGNLTTVVNYKKDKFIDGWQIKDESLDYKHWKNEAQETELLSKN